MKTCAYAGEPLTVPRSHPWVDVVGKPECRYYDLTAHPERIRTSIEDFQPWGQYAAAEAFYELLERLNQRSSTLESNDCAFTGPEENDQLAIDKPLQCSGRLMVLFRVLAHNTEQARVARLESEIHRQLSTNDPSFLWGIVGTTVVPVLYRGLPGSAKQQLGSQLMISFWAWGDSEADTMRNLGRLFENLSRALLAVSSSAA